MSYNSIEQTERLLRSHLWCCSDLKMSD